MRILATSGGFLPVRHRPVPLAPRPAHRARHPPRRRPRAAAVLLHRHRPGDSLERDRRVLPRLRRLRRRASHLELFTMPNVPDVRAHLLAQDVIWVGGGSVANLLAVWRVHGLDDVLRECWESGVVLGGVSAGSICWYVGGTTDSYGTDLRLSRPGSACCPTATASTTTARSSAARCCTRWSPRATCPTSHATDDGVGLSTRAPSWSRRSPTVPTSRRTSSSGRTTAPSPRPGSSRGCWAEQVCVIPTEHPLAPSG